MKESIAKKWIEKHGEECFKENQNLRYIAVVIKDRNDYQIEFGIKGDDKVKLKKSYCYKNSGIDDSIIYIGQDIKTPKHPDKIEVVIKESDDISLQTNHTASTARHERMTGGISVSLLEDSSTYGTAGAFFRMKDCNDIFMISNHHVLGKSDEDNCVVVHPSVDDAYCHGLKPVKNAIGNVFWKCESSIIDAAITKVKPCNIDQGRYTRCEDIDFSGGIGVAKLGEDVRKCGRTTGMKTGIIVSTFCYVNVTIDIRGNKKLFKNQIMTTLMSDHGDSGSVLVNNKNTVVGLHFAGSGKKSYFNNIMEVFSAFENECFPNNDFEKFV